MHNGCSGDHESGKQIVDKIRMMGFNSSPLEAPLEITCTNCDTIFQNITSLGISPDGTYGILMFLLRHGIWSNSVSFH